MGKDNKALETDLVIKLVLLGETSVGKTNLIGRYFYNEFIEDVNPTIGMDFCSQTVEFEGNRV